MAQSEGGEVGPVWIAIRMKTWTYYNENEPMLVAWLENMIRDGRIPPGEVDARSIKEVQPEDLNGFTRCHFFAGVAGWEIALQLAEWPAGKPVWTGSPPCQPWSAAGKKKGKKDARDLWPVFRSLIRQRRPDVVFMEQVKRAIRMGYLDRVSSELETEGYRVGAKVLGAHSVSAPHQRQRLWIAADTWAVAHAINRSPRPTLSSEHLGEGEEGSETADLHTGGGKAGGMADSRHSERRPAVEGVRTEPSDDRQLVHTKGQRREPIVGRVPPGEPDAERAVQEGRGSLGKSRRPRLQAREREPETPEGGRPAFPPGPWDEFILYRCLDGKVRRGPEPGIQLLVDGISPRMAPVLPYSRAGAVKAFANAIVPQVAAQFIMGYIKIRKEEGTWH